jgi:hypothetical protein
MKKTKEIVGILVVVLITLCSCTNESVEIIQPQLLKKIVEVSVDGTSTITTLNYSGNKLQNIDKADAFLEFYYTGSLINKIVETNKATSGKNTLEYNYVDGQLNKITSSDNYTINYKQNKDGSVSYEKWTKDSNNVAVKVYVGTLFFQNGNLIKDEKIIEDTKKGILTTKTVNVVRDNRKNALHNILGFNKLLDFAKNVSANNCIIHTESCTEKQLDVDQIISSIKRYDSKIQYNSNGYPIEIVSENIIFGGADSKHLKSQLFYN